MYLGQRLIVPGAILGSLLLALVLYLLTSGLSYPVAAQAAGAPVDAAPVSETGSESIDVPYEADAALDAEVDGSNNSGPCEVSDQFPEKILQWCGLITHYASRRELPIDLVAALILQESGGDSVAYSHSGAVGLMQVMPSDGLASGFMCVNGPCFGNRPSTSELEDPEFNVAYGTKMLSGLVQKHGDVREALRSYGPMDMGYAYADTVLALYKRYGK